MFLFACFYQKCIIFQYFPSNQEPRKFRSNYFSPSASYCNNSAVNIIEKKKKYKRMEHREFGKRDEGRRKIEENQAFKCVLQPIITSP